MPQSSRTPLVATQIAILREPLPIVPVGFVHAGFVHAT